MVYTILNACVYASCIRFIYELAARLCVPPIIFGKLSVFFLFSFPFLSFSSVLFSRAALVGASYDTSLSSRPRSSSSTVVVPDYYWQPRIIFLGGVLFYVDYG